jgi:hypothetical protein
MTTISAKSYVSVKRTQVRETRPQWERALLGLGLSSLLISQPRLLLLTISPIVGLAIKPLENAKRLDIRRTLNYNLKLLPQRRRAED